MQLSSERVDELGNLLTDAVLAAAREGLVSEDELPLISQEVLYGVDDLKTEDEVLPFLEKYSSKWEFLRAVLMTEKDKKAQKADSLAADEAAALAKTGNIDEALKVVKEAEKN